MLTQLNRQSVQALLNVKSTPNLIVSAILLRAKKINFVLSTTTHSPAHAIHSSSSSFTKKVTTSSVAPSASAQIHSKHRASLTHPPKESKMADTTESSNAGGGGDSAATTPQAELVPSTPSVAPILGPDGLPLSKNQLKKLAKGKGQYAPDAAAGAGAGASSIATAATEKASKKKDATTAAATTPADASAPASGGEAVGAGAGTAATAAAASKKEKKVVERYDYVNTTPEGAKKELSGEMLPAYHPQAVEAAWDSWWTKQGYYSCDPAVAAAAGEEKRFVMVIPPPNVTGSLHLGHALTSAVEDCLTRWNRMNGRPTMWLPGTDHAGIATQTVVEKRLKKEKNLSRHDLGREAFMKEVWAWKETYGNRITSQLRQLGVSADWSRERFTMDDVLSKAVNEAFVRFHEAGILYRDNRLVNWCCTLRSAISDIEVEYIDLEKKTKFAVPGHNPEMKYEFGCITSFKYMVADAEGKATEDSITVATTRPETMLGDTAVAVHPDDARYKHLHGKHLVHPFNGRLIPIITDGILVDMAFGTGAVKVTPAHDPNDFICGKRHNLPFITVFSEDGKVNDNGGEFAGMMRFDARYAVTKALDEKKLLVGKADNKMRLGVCSRTGDVIEPLMKPQWYVKCDEMAKRAADACRSGELNIQPENHRATWYHWMDNIKDWCVSRQLWWGHRIPAYYVTIEGKAPPTAGQVDANYWVVARTVDAARTIAAARFGVAEALIQLKQDEDVLDTWFSSGLFPFSTFGWPDENHPDYKAFYPNSLLETGHDILFFWVARMVMMGLQLTGKLPFKTVYLHAMVRDKYGRKMSKSLGNVVDPLEVIHGCDLETLHSKVRDGNLPPKEVETAIKGQKMDFPDGLPECGADALRFGLLAYTVQGRDINLDISRVVGYRQFCNKLWNATRFALTHLAADRYTPAPLLDAIDELTSSPHLAVRDRWILSRLNNCITSVDTAMKEYIFGAATSAIYGFFLYELCDYYLELLKPLMSGDALAATEANGDVALAQRLARTTLHVCLEYGFRLLHPMMPFVTEELWQRLPGRGQPLRAGAGGAPADWPSIMIAAYPSSPFPGMTRPDVEADFTLFQAVVRSGRSLRSDADIIPSKSVTLYVAAEDEATRVVLQRQLSDFKVLLRAEAFHIVAKQSDVAEGCSVQVVNDKCSLHLLLKGLIDPVAEVAKLEKRAAKLESDIRNLKNRMNASTYATKVPEDVRAADTESASAWGKQLETLQALKLQYQSWAAAATSSSSTTA